MHTRYAWLRVRRESHLIFMPQYDHSLVALCFQTFLDAVAGSLDRSDGAPRWDQRTYHPDTSGTVRPSSALWDHVPAFLETILNTVRLAETTQLLSKLCIYFGEPAGSMPNLSGQEEGAG